MPPSQEEVGIDVGLSTFAYVSTEEAIANRRKNFIQQEVCQLVARFGFIAVEALVVRTMVKNPRLSKSLADASWSMFFTRLVVKAEEAGRKAQMPVKLWDDTAASGHSPAAREP